MRCLEAKILCAVDAKNNPDFYNQHNCDGDFYNKGHTKATRQLMRKPKSNTENYGRGESNNASRPEVKAKISQSMLGNDRTKGKHWYTDSVTETLAFEPPTGFIPGRLESTYENMRKPKRKPI